MTAGVPEGNPTGGEPAGPGVPGPPPEGSFPSGDGEKGPDTGPTGSDAMDPGFPAAATLDITGVKDSETE